MALSPKGIDVRQTTTALVFRASLKDSSGAKVTSGTTEIRIYELQSDGTIKWYDWSANTFGTGTPTDDEQSMTHRTYTDHAAGSQNTGIWTYALSTLTGFTVGGIYIVQITNSGATPESQEREFQFGGEQGDIVVTSGRPEVDVKAVDGDTDADGNLKLAYNGTGYAGGTTQQRVNATLISGSSTAADNVELFFADGTAVGNFCDAYDGTGYAGGTILVKANVMKVEDVSVETTGQIGAAFYKFFNKAAPTGTVNSLPDAVAGASGGVAIVGSVMGKSPATLAAGDVTGNLPADVQTVKTQTVTCAAGVTVLPAVGTASTSTAQTGDSYALANGASGFVAIKGDTAAILDDTGTSGVVVATVIV